MKERFVYLKSEVTSAKKGLEKTGHEVYRVRMNCRCEAGHNRRSGILAIKAGEVTHKVARCKACAGKEAGNVKF